MMNRDNPAGLVTGCSTGFGRELARLVLGRGWLDSLRNDFDAWEATTLATDFPDGTG